jgi:hypothetical protein
MERTRTDSPFDSSGLGRRIAVESKLENEPEVQRRCDQGRTMRKEIRVARYAIGEELITIARARLFLKSVTAGSSAVACRFGKTIDVLRVLRRLITYRAYALLMYEGADLMRGEG